VTKTFLQPHDIGYPSLLPLKFRLIAVETKLTGTKICMAFEGRSIEMNIKSYLANYHVRNLLLVAFAST
jgi:hypothetical protein